MTATTRRHTLLLVVLAVAVVLSGCQAPGTGPNYSLTSEGLSNETDGGSDNITDPVYIYVDGVPVDTQPGLIYERLQLLLGVNTSAPERIQSSSTTDLPDEAGQIGLQQTPRFFSVFGFETGEVEGEGFVDRVGNGLTYNLGRVQVYISPTAASEEVEMLLAHELAHYIQFQNGRSATLAEEIDTQTVDGAYVLRSLVEGTTVFTTDAYLQTYEGTDTLNSPYYDREQQRYPPGHLARWANSRYQIGTDYVESQVDSPSDIGEIYEDPPTRSRELLDPDAGQRPALATTLAHDRDRISKNRLGAAFTRFGLESHIEPSRAEAVADGFGTDSLYQYSSGPETYGNYVWVTRWESEADAERFDAAVTDYFDARGTQTADGWRLPERNLTVELRHPGADTRALVVGSESFVEETVTGGREGVVSIESDD